MFHELQINFVLLQILAIYADFSVIFVNIGLHVQIIRKTNLKHSYSYIWSQFIVGVGESL